MAEHRKLQVGIVGAGVAGLAAAIALARTGHHVQIFEKSSFKNEIGAAITLSPNANLILERWGFDFKAAGETAKCQFRRLHWKTMNLEFQDSFDHVQAKYGHAFNAFHRVDLHREMRRIAEDKLGVQINLGSHVKKIDCPTGTLMLEDGREIQNDLVVVADGVKSQFVQAITGRDLPFTQTNRSVFRTIIPMERLMEDEKIRPVLENEPSGFVTSALGAGQDAFFVTYPCRDDKLMNIAIFHPTRPHLKSAEGKLLCWSAPATLEDVDDVISDFHPVWRAIASKADSYNVYRVEHRNEVNQMVNGRACIIGDAAHAMMPSKAPSEAARFSVAKHGVNIAYAQGGCMALEDAAALEVLMADVNPEKDLETRLKLFEQLRLPRCATTQALSNHTWGNTFRDGFSQRIQQQFQHLLPPPGLNSFSSPWRDFFYSYNIYEEAEKALKYKEIDSVPDGVLKWFGLNAVDGQSNGIQSTVVH
ncbi:FAD/NAD(P)-binding domain-containing protein [Rhizodiscina lignyota]|uniref:FAD/NAD(P)-binding domain-containing protein n=1 Tax=Rhizodiscina lignyota TaxID=1504668 RepID=A0A9P4IK09_9PEZI|nr:FAD/NAD(P)-binding domain-containing protein [Rhizodiscina lignyota]